MNDFVVTILLVIGVPTALVLVRLLWYWTTGQLQNNQVEDNPVKNNPVKQDVKEFSDSKIICLRGSRGGMRVICCNYKTMPDDAIEQLLESDSYTEGFAFVKGNKIYKQVAKDFRIYCNNIGLNNFYETPETYIDFTESQEATQCVSCDIFPWVICEWKGDISQIPRPRDYSDVKLSEAQKRFCESFDRDADRNADYRNKL